LEEYLEEKLEILNKNLKEIEAEDEISRKGEIIKERQEIWNFLYCFHSSRTYKEKDYFIHEIVNQLN
jgi:hypothetical protein